MVVILLYQHGCHSAVSAWLSFCCISMVVILLYQHGCHSRRYGTLPEVGEILE
jgi:hypothetical protein